MAPILDESLSGLNATLADRFRIQRELGAGAMAKVYLTEDLKHHRQVAMKVLRPELAVALGRERFLREIEIIAHLRHPHILPLHDSDVRDDVYCFIMPYVEGGSLRDRLEREVQLPIDDALRIAREVADALAYAHARGVVHRDIKPHNIMLEAGHAFVTDFGIAHLSDTTSPTQLTATGISPGTPQYMSPEQFAGGRHADARSDIYSLGCVLYEMLAGQPPFTGSTVYAIFARQATERPPSLRVVRPTVSESLERVVFKALARVPADRYQTAEELASALADVSHQQATTNLARSDDTLNAGVSAVGGAGVAVLGGAAAGRGTLASLRSTVFRVIAPLAIIGVSILAVGVLTVAAFDAVLQVPAPFTPTRSDFALMGLRALVPSTVYAFLTVIAALMLRQIARLLTSVGATLTRERATALQLGRRWHRFWLSAQPATAADLFLAASFLLSVFVIARFGPLLAALFRYDVEVLGCNNRAALRVYQPAMTMVITGLAISWFYVFRWINRRTGQLRSVAYARWGSAGLIVLLILIMTLPWRLLWPGGTERVRIGEERGYILRETDTHLVIHNAARRTTTAYAKPDIVNLTRLGIHGYVFEESSVFDSGIPECDSIVFPR